MSLLLSTGYAYNLIHLVFNEVVHDPRPFVDAVKQMPVPQPMSAQYDRPAKDEAVAGHVSRFSQGKV